MREILFRGKQVDSKRWIIGSLLTFKDGECFICAEQQKDVLHKYQVIPETIGQYTGLPDKKGKKIFEGDIVKMRSYGGEYHNATIYFKNGKFAVDGSNYRFKDICSNSVEVIGNIYDGGIAID